MDAATFRGVAALVLAVGLSATVILLAVETILHTGAISDREASLLSTVLGAVIGALAVYLGGHSTNGTASGAVPLEPEATPPDELEHRGP